MLTLWIIYGIRVEDSVLSFFFHFFIFSFFSFIFLFLDLELGVSIMSYEYISFRAG